LVRRNGWRRDMPFEWTVSIKADFPEVPSAGFPGGIFEAEYTFEGYKRYTAVAKALEDFIKKNKLPFRPYQLRSTYRSYIDIRTKCSEDARIKNYT
jgi:hypothetical protein